MSAGRRTFLKRAGGFALCLQAGLSGACSACSAPPSRPSVLEWLVEGVAMPDCHRILEESERLEQLASALEAAPSRENLRSLQAQWKRTALAWKRGYAFRAGPITESNALVRAMFWPIREHGIAALIAEGKALEAHDMEELGVDRKGLYAMEFLLFSESRSAGAPRVLEGASNHLRRYLTLLSQDVAAYAHDIGTGMRAEAGFAKRFAQTSTESLETLVNHMIVTVESIAVQRLEFAVQSWEQQRHSVSSIEGEPSGLSSQILKVMLETIQALYEGRTKPGIGALVRTASEDIDRRLAQLFRAALESVRALDAPLLEMLATRPELVSEAARRTRELEVALKVDMASALGVMLTFSLGDGD